VFQGISSGSVLLVVALGLAITFGLMGVINMAHGEFITIGGYACYLTQLWFIERYGSSGAGFDSYFLMVVAGSPSWRRRLWAGWWSW